MALASLCRSVLRNSFPILITIGYLSAATCLGQQVASGTLDARVDYAKQVQPLLTKYCSGCHNDDDAEADVQLHSLEALQIADKAEG